jgi:hypothetical protein
MRRIKKTRVAKIDQSQSRKKEMGEEIKKNTQLTRRKRKETEEAHG